MTSFARRPGATLVEIVVVLLILGLVAATVSPALGQRATDDGSVAASVEKVLKTARNAAVVTNSVREVVVDQATSRVWILGAERDSVFLLEMGASRKNFSAARQSAAARVTVRFAPDGRATVANLVLDGPNGPELVSVLPGGRVQRKAVGTP